MSVTAIDKPPASLPFLDAVAARFNVRISREEATLLATYERYWLMTRVLGPLEGAERRFVRRLAQKHHSFLTKQL